MAKRGGSAHVATIKTKGKDGTVYTSQLLRRSYREGGKVRHENLGNLSHLPAEIIEVIPGITRVILHYGFMQYPTIYEGLILACNQGKLPGIDLTDITYYIGRETIIPREDIPGMWVWRETVFAFLQRNAERSAAFFGVPTKQVVEFGTEIEI